MVLFSTRPTIAPCGVRLATTSTAGKARSSLSFPTMVDMRGKMTPALRVRIPPSKGGNGPGVAVPPQPPPPTPSAQQQLDEFGQAQSPEKPSLSDDLDDEIGF